MITLMILSLIASFIYLFVGINVIRLYRKSNICQIFFVLTLSLAIWSLPGAFVFLAENTYEYAFWNKISALGWCTFEAIALYFVLILTENKFMRHWYAKLLVLLPALISLYMALFLFGPDIDTPQIIEDIFYKGNFLYNFIYSLFGIILIIRWGTGSKSRLQRKQAFIISLSSAISFFLTLLIQTIIPAMGFDKIPSLGQVYSLVMMYGAYYSIQRYQFMSIPTSLISNELFKELTGLTFLIDSQGLIIKTNRQLYQLLDYSENEVIGKHISEIIKYPGIDMVIDNSEGLYTTVRFEEVPISTKTDKVIPFQISIIPLQRKSGYQLGLLILGEDITAIVNQRRIEAELKQNYENINKLNNELIEMNQKLIQKSNRDSLTNLYNHQYINMILEDLLVRVKKDTADICVMMLDIDYFKQVNDSYGHLTGDKILVSIGDIIKECIHSSDYIGRYGGEEFLVVMPDIKPEAAALIAEKIRSSIETFDFGLKDLTVTISIGVARYEGETPKDLVNKADKLLYQAKSNGRNRFEVELE